MKPRVMPRAWLRATLHTQQNECRSAHSGSIKRNCGKLMGFKQSAFVPSFVSPHQCHISRISSAPVLQRNWYKHVSTIWKIRQLALPQSIAALPDDDGCRRFIVQPSTFVLERGPGASIVPIWSNLISTFDV